MLMGIGFKAKRIFNKSLRINFSLLFNLMIILLIRSSTLLKTHIYTFLKIPNLFWRGNSMMRKLKELFFIWEKLRHSVLIDSNVDSSKNIGILWGRMWLGLLNISLTKALRLHQLTKLLLLSFPNLKPLSLSLILGQLICVFPSIVLFLRP